MLAEAIIAAAQAIAQTMRVVSLVVFAGMILSHPRRVQSRTNVRRGRNFH
jgi:hypothetical protein